MKDSHYWKPAGACIALALLLSCPAMSWAAEQAGGVRSSASQAAPINESNPQEALLAAEKRFEEAEKDFNKGASQADPATGSGSSISRTTPGSGIQTNSTRPYYEDPRIQAYQGSPETGYAGTWSDPATGDIITSVIAPSPQYSNGQAQNYPIVIEPQVYGTGWSGSDTSSSGSSSWQGGWQNDSPQWPGHPGDNGYPPPPPPPPASNPGLSGYPSYGPFPGYVPNNPVPPFPTGHRPLRPTAGPGMMPNPGGPGPSGMPGQPGYPGVPPTTGWPPSYQPAPPNAWQPNAPGTPGWVPPSNQPAPPNAWQPKPQRPPSGWRPGGGFQPIHPIQVPGAQPFPMTPGGASWGNGIIRNNPGAH